MKRSTIMGLAVAAALGLGMTSFTASAADTSSSLWEQLLQTFGVVGSGAQSSGVVGSGLTTDGVVGSGLNTDGVVGSGLNTDGVVGSGLHTDGVVGSGK